MDNEEFGLSGNALEALKAFAQENNLKVGEEDDIVSGIQKALNIETDKKYTNLNYNYKDNKNNIHISLKSIDQEYGQQLQSTGLTVWRAAEELAHYIFSRRSLFQGKSVIELGAGLGLDGVLLACVNKEGYVNITDGDEENGNTLQLLEENLKANSHLLKLKNTHVQRLWWGNDDEINKALANLNQHNQQEGQESNEEGYDLIFGADVVYNESQVNPLVYTVDKLLKKKDKNAKFYLSFAKRNVPIDKVIEEAQKYQLECKIVDYKCQNVGEYIYEFKRKQQ